MPIAYTLKIIRVGKSVAVIIPQPIRDGLNWKAGDIVRMIIGTKLETRKLSGFDIEGEEAVIITRLKKK